MKIGPDEIFAIEAIPARGAIVVVRTAEVRASIRRIVLERYGSEIAGRVDVVAIRDRGDTGRLAGAKKRVFLDPGYSSTVNDETLNEVRRLAAAANARVRK